MNLFGIIIIIVILIILLLLYYYLHSKSNANKGITHEVISKLSLLPTEYTGHTEKQSAALRQIADVNNLK